MGVAGVMGVSLNLGDFLTSCLAGVAVVAISNGGPGLFLRDDLVGMIDPIFSTGDFDPRPNFGRGFGFFLFLSVSFSLSLQLLFFFFWLLASTCLDPSPSSPCPYCKGSSQYFT